jgi:ubiquitin carboxyl-terminal hydrolase L5
MALESADTIRTAHNSFSHPEPFEYEEVAAKEGDDVFHFISYIPFHDGVYELDGMQKGPVFIGKIEEGKDWLVVARAEIQKRMEDYISSEIHFNLLAIIGDRETSLRNEIQKDKVLKAELMQKVGLPIDMEVKEEDLAKYKAEIDALPKDSKDMGTLIETLEVKINENTHMLVYEVEKRKKWTRENQRRRHNYLPFIFELLKLLAEKGKLAPMIDKATEEMKKRKAKKAEKKK